MVAKFGYASLTSSKVLPKKLDEEVAKDIAMHIAASNPLCISEADMDSSVVQKEQTKLESFSGALDSLRSWFFCSVGPDRLVDAFGADIPYPRSGA